MPTIIRRVPATGTLAVGQTVDNVLGGSQYEFAPFDGTIEVGILGSIADMQCSVFSGPDVLAEPGSVIDNAGAIRSPKYPDDFFLEDDVAQGDRLKISVTNTGAAVGVAVVALRISPA
jgi:hypothetical protein